MPIQVTMPRLSDTMQQGTIVKWNAKEGQKVKTGDVIADIETDKATMELQSFDDGVVAFIAVPEGQQVPVGTLMMVLASAGEDAAAIKAQHASGKPVAAKAPTATATVAAQAAAGSAPATPAITAPSVATATAVAPAPSNGHAPAGHDSLSINGGRIFASPLARKIAAESGLDLSRIEGSGPSGRIVRRDVEAMISTASTAGRVTAPSRAEQPAAAARTAAPILSHAGAALESKLVPLSSMRSTIARRLVESKTTIPHYQVTVDIDMDPLLTLRSQLNDQLSSQGVKLSVNDFLVRACALAMHQHPFVNARWVDGGTGQNPSIQIMSDVNIGIAIAIPEERGGGLVVATIRNADQIGLRSISSQSKQLSEKARTKGLSPQEMSDSTFTISNLGMFGVAHFTAIINPPNAAILAVGAAVEKPVVKNGQVVVGHVMSMTMSSDHRIIDGAMAAQYLATVKGLLEKPAALLV